DGGAGSYRCAEGRGVRRGRSGPARRRAYRRAARSHRPAPSAAVAFGADHAFEMKVVVVGGIVFRTQHGVEPLAGAALHDAEKFALFRGPAVPARLDRDAAPVVEHEARDVDRRGAGMRRAPARTGDVAARIAAERLDAAHTGP